MVPFVLIELGLRFLQFFAPLDQFFLQPDRSFLGGGKTQVQGLFDVRLGQGIDHGGGKLGVRIGKTDVHQAALPNGVYLHSLGNGANQIFLGPLFHGVIGVGGQISKNRSIRWVVFQVKFFCHFFGQSAAFQQLVMGLIKFFPGRVVLSRGSRLVDIMRGLALDQELYGGLVNRGGGEGLEGRESYDGAKYQQDQPPSFYQDPEIIMQGPVPLGCMHFLPHLFHG